jgi:pyrroline-5-carboxylate reductase
LLLLAMPAIFALFGAGCSGVNTSQSVSPLDFLLPGVGHFIKVEPSSTNAPVVFRETSVEIASVK